VISGTPATSVQVGAAYSFTPTASDANGGTLTFSINPPAPSWATFNSATGRLQGTPATSHTGSYSNFVISVSDGLLSTSLAAFSITVVNAPPAISGTPGTTATVGTQYTFTPTGSDPNAGTTLTYSINQTPAWASFNPTTGRLQGTPGSAHVGSTGNIVISVSDGVATTALSGFSIAVSEPANRAPVISGTPPTQVMQGTQYSFTPTASDPDAGDTLTFSIQNKPTWATFSTSTGALQGTPGAGDVGTTTNIVISVRDPDNASAALNAFNIAVQSTATGSALLTWVPPTQNTDGTPLVNLNGYKVYWGTTQGNYPNAVTLDDQPGLASYVVDNLTPGTYFFVVTALNALGVESQFSSPASKTIP
jgi:putative Ig domain-containing protein